MHRSIALWGPAKEWAEQWLFRCLGQPFQKIPTLFGWSRLAFVFSLGCSTSTGSWVYGTCCDAQRCTVRWVLQVNQSMTILTPMPPPSFARYRDSAAKGYADDNVAAGRWPEAGALQRSYDDFDESLPQGLDTPDNYIFEIRDEVTNTIVGEIWFAIVVKNGIRSAFVYDLEVHPEFRRQGHARAAFIALEPLVESLGLSSIGLHVFGHNPVAQALYSSLGYGVTGINMRKTVGKN